MASDVKCPACGNRGTLANGSFDARGQFDGQLVLRCSGCTGGLFVRSLRKPKVIPHDLWLAMCAEWADRGPANPAQPMTDPPLALWLEVFSAAPRALLDDWDHEGHLGDLGLGCFGTCLTFSMDHYVHLAENHAHWQMTDSTRCELVLLGFVAVASGLALAQGWGDAIALDMNLERNEVERLLAAHLIVMSVDRRASSMSIHRIFESFAEGDGSTVVRVVATELRELAGLDDDAFAILLDAPLLYPAMYRVHEQLRLAS